MQIEVVESLAEPVGRLWQQRQQAAIANGQSFNVAAPLSSTPLPVFEWVINNAESFGDWSNVNFVLMDEQLDEVNTELSYVAVDDNASYEGFAQRNLLTPLADRIGVAVPVIKPDLDQLATFHIQLDLVILALGVDGNYANVMPGTPMETGWHVADLLPAFNQAHTAPGSASYAGAKFRDKGMSLGPQQVVQATEVVVIASGHKKLALVERLLSTTMFEPAFPLSVIHDPAVESKVTLFPTFDCWPDTRL